MLTLEDQSKLELALGNDCPLDDDGWALIAPYGQWPKQRVAKVNGVPTLQRFIQVLDNDSADALLSSENGFFRKIKRALVGIPVYGSKEAAHPDLAQYSPETLSNARGAQRVIGVVDKVRKSPKGIEAHFSLTPDGAHAVENDGLKYPSALWFGKGETRADGVIVFRPATLVSVGLTANPNISGVDSLANARPAGETQTAETKTEPDMKLIAGWLMARGTTLANSEAPSETQVLEAFQKLLDAQTGRVTALGNEKDTIAGQLSTLQTEKATLTTKVTTLENSLTPLNTRITALENSVKVERKAAAAAVVDLAIHKGKLTIAERAAQIEALANTADQAAFDAAAKALLEKGGKVVKLQGNAEERKALANDGACGDEPSTRDQYLSAMSDHMKANPTDGPMKAHNAVKKKFPALFPDTADK